MFRDAIIQAAGELWRSTENEWKSEKCPLKPVSVIAGGYHITVRPLDRRNGKNQKVKK